MKGLFKEASSFTQLVAVACITLLTLLLSGIFFYFLQQNMAMDNAFSIRLMMTMQSVFVFLIPAILSQYLLFGKSLLEGFQLKKAALLYFILGIGIMICIPPIVTVIEVWYQSIPTPTFLKGIAEWIKLNEEKSNSLLQLLFATQTWQNLAGNLLVICLLTGIVEEFFFRGILQKIIIRLTGNTHLGILVTAITFSLLHLQSTGFISRILIGALLGYMLIWSRTLWLPILAHACNNAIAVISETYYPSTDSIVEPIDTSIVIGSLFLVTLFTLGLWLLFRGKLEFLTTKHKTIT